MTTRTLLLLLALVGLLPPGARAQTARDLTDIGIALFQQANAPDALERMRRDLVEAPEAYLEAAEQPGTLVLLATKQQVRVPSLRYNVALHLLEVRDSTGFHVWPPGSLDGFYLGRGATARHFRSRNVRGDGPRLDFVEMLTSTDDALLQLAVQHHYVHDDAQLNPVLHTVIKPARTLIAQVVVAGPGGSPEPLRELSLTPRNVSRLFGSRAAAVDAYAQRTHLDGTNLAHLQQLVEYYNQLAAAPGR
jgi:hypothetical protein